MKQDPGNVLEFAEVIGEAIARAFMAGKLTDSKVNGRGMAAASEGLSDRSETKGGDSDV